MSASPTRPAAPAATRSVRGEGGFDSSAVDRIVLPELPVSYRPAGAAATTGISRPYLAAEIKAGRLLAMKLNGAVLIPKQALQDWLDRFAKPFEIRK